MTIDFEPSAIRLTLRPRRLEATDPKLPMRMIPDQVHFVLPDNETAEFVIRRKAAKTSSRKVVATAPRQECEPEGIVVVGSLSGAQWKSILTRIGLLTNDGRVVNETGAEVDFSDSTPAFLLRCVSGTGHILSEREIETINTFVDGSGEYVGATIVTVCDLDPAARTLAEKFGRKKSFDVIGPTRLAQVVFSHVSEPLREHLLALDGAECTARIVLHGSSFVVLVCDRRREAWFYIVDESGRVLPESHHEVVELRDAHPSYVSKTYGATSLVALPPGSEAFDRTAYLARAHEEFRSLKYSAVAPYGYGFPQGDLLDVYISPSAEEAKREEPEDERKRRLLNEMLEWIELDEAQRKQLETFIATRTNLPLAETDYAQSLYQQHRNIAILGDPGSGKTCFIKRQILSYCQSEHDSWYRIHTPVFVALAEAGPVLTSADDFLGVISALSARRGLDISASALEELLAQGTVAFFFDGLDEIASLAQRARVLEAIEHLMARGVSRGNRFVLTSRPAAVHLVKLPEALRSLHLRGLSDAEIRLLATKVVSAEFFRGGEKVRFATSTKHGEQLVDRLLEDCKSNPGIGRLARNPLLLTLLVMIYANTGALAAKRHRVYAQAVMTLVSVRNRKDGSFAHSEADLRRRLGRIALIAFTSDSGPPTRSDAVDAVEAAILADGRTPDAGEGERFLQSVAEATGLLVFSRSGIEVGTVSFMHQSFLEYYAATGLLSEKDAAAIADFFDKARWRDIVTLSAGILHDAGSVSPLISRLCEIRDDADRVRRDRLLFAIDCALECDVPPDQAQRAIAAALSETMSKGVARIDSEFRRELGGRIGKLLVASGSMHVHGALLDGVTSKDPRCAAATIELASHIALQVDLKPEFMTAFDALAASDDQLVQAAILNAAEKSVLFRRPRAVDLISRGVANGGSALQYAAVRAAPTVPGSVSRMRTELMTLLNASKLSTAAACARAILEHDIRGWADVAERSVIERCLYAWEAFARVVPDATLKIDVTEQDIRALLASGDISSRVLGLRLVPWLRGGEMFAYNAVMSELAASSAANDRLQLAALGSLRISAGTRALLRSSDIDVILATLTTEPARPGDVRAAALRVLGQLQLSSVQLDELLAFSRDASWATERELAACLAEHAVRSEQARVRFFEGCEQELNRYGQAFGNTRRQGDVRRILAACVRAQGPAPGSLVRILLSYATNFRTPREVRGYALLALCHVGRPNAEMFSRCGEWLSTMDHHYWPIVATGVSALVRQGRKAIDWGRDVQPALAELRPLLAARWLQLAAGVAGRIDDRDCHEIRTALGDVGEVLAAG